MDRLLKVVFRVDSSADIGTGHIVRCLTLADALRQSGYECQFVCRDHRGGSKGLVARHGYPVALLPPADSDFTIPGHAGWLGVDWTQDANETSQLLSEIAPDWLIVDHYALDARWERTLRPYCRHLMVVDDLADRPHDCDLLLDQNLGRSVVDYADFVRPGADILAGPQYALLRPEFERSRSQSLSRRQSCSFDSLLVSMGGIDKDNFTEQVLDVIDRCSLPPEFHVRVIVGEHSPWRNRIQDRANQMRYRTDVLVNVSDMAHLMADSDLAIGGAGTTAWERCCLGLPAIVMVLADNQKAGATALQDAGAAIVASNTDEIGNMLAGRQAEFCAGLSAMSNASAAVTDGRGTQRTTEAIMKYDR